MNPFVFTVFALCLSTGALASQSYAGANNNNQYASSYPQRKMSPAPQQYGAAQNTGYGPTEQSSYGAEMGSYNEQPAQTYQAPAPAYKAPSSAQVSSYDERAPAASGYAKQQSYGKQQQSYAAPAANYGDQARQAANYEQYHAPMPFAWGYDINDGYGGAQYHKETGDEYGKRTGSYGYTDAYGVYRQVDYVADEHGFRATIKTNEPGTANESPADVELHAYEPPSNYYAGAQSGYAAKASKGYAAQGQQASSYGQQAPSYGQQASSYGQQAPSYGQQRASYAKQQSSYAAPARQAYQEQQSYSSSAIKPVYLSAAAAPAVASAKKY